MNCVNDKKARLLIADDEPSVRDLLHSLLSEDYDCTTVSSSEEALTHLGAATVAAIITPAHNLGLKAIAEGVETEEQLELPRRMDCDEIQGYPFGKPMPAEEFECLLNESRSRLTKNSPHLTAETVTSMALN